MRILFATLAVLASLGRAAFAQGEPTESAFPAPSPEQQAAPLAKPALEGTAPALPQPPSPEAATPADPLQPQTAIEGSPPAAPASVQPLPPANSPAPPLQRETVRVSPQAATYLQEIGIDPNAADVIEVSQDAVGAYSLDALAAQRDETQVRRFIYTRIFMHRFLADPDNVRIEPDKYDIAFLTPEEVKLIADELNR